MSRWKFIFHKDERKDNVELVKSLEKARIQAERKLLKVYIESTTRCTGNCLHCCFYPNHGEKEIPFNEIIEMLDFLHEGGVQSVTYAGGDPIVREDHLKILEHGKKIGLRQTFCPRGWLKDLDRIEEVAAIGPEHIQLSCDPIISGLSIEAELDRVEKVGEALRKYPIHVSWVTTFVRGSSIYLIPILNKIKNSGGHEYRIHRVLPWGRILKYPELIPTNGEFIETMYNFTYDFFNTNSDGILYAEEASQTLRESVPPNALGRTVLVGCPVGQTALTISYDGSVYLCPLCRQEALKLGSSWRKIFTYWNDFQKTLPFTQSSFKNSMCASCEDFNTCLGGCRCQAVVKCGNLWGIDPTCSYSERKEKI